MSESAMQSGPSSDVSLPPGYRFVRHLGSGGMGDVLLVQDSQRDTPVVLKRIRGSISKEVRQRFLREIQVLATLEHPGIATIHEAGIAPDGAPYFTMPHLEGALPLSSWIVREHGYRSATLPPPLVLGVIAPVALGLDQVHANHICHRDIKPGNIMVSESGRGVLIDFGLAGGLDGEMTKLTRTGNIVGTMRYVSPEQARNDPLGPASDIYQLGVVLQEVLTGRSAVRDAFDYVRKLLIHEDPFECLEQSTPWISASLAAVISRARSLQPEDRFLSGRAFIDALTAIPANEWYRQLSGANSEPPHSPEDNQTTATSKDRFLIPVSDPYSNRFPDQERSRPLTPGRVDIFRDVDSSFRDRYQIGVLLGEGGAGIVHRGQDLSLNRRVAIKFMRRSVVETSPESLKRFIQEAQILASLKHPNLVEVYDLQVEGSTAYIVFEFVEGVPLDRWLEQRTPLPVPEVVSLAMNVLAGLDALHERQIIHRDIKPSNLIRTTSGIKILDLGIARVLDSIHPSMTRTGQLIGTPAFASPEQIRGFDMDHTTDFYSLGLVLYTCLTGRFPFEGSRFEVIALKVSGEPTPISRYREIPPFLEKLVMAMIDRNPSNRPRSGAKLIQELGRRRTSRLKSGTAPRARESSSSIPTRDWLRGKRAAPLWLLLLSAGVVLALAWGVFRLQTPGPRLSALKLERGLDRLKVQFDRIPPGPAGLRVEWPDGTVSQMDSPKSTPVHEFTLEGLQAGVAITLRPTADGVEGPPLSFRHRAIDVEDLTLRRVDSSLQVNLKTTVDARVRIGARTGISSSWITPPGPAGSVHSMNIPLEAFPYGPPFVLEMSRGDAVARRDLGLTAETRPVYLEAAVDWYSNRVMQQAQVFDERLKDLDARSGLFLSGKEMDEFIEILSSLDSSMPREWFLDLLGGPQGYLDAKDVTPERKNDFDQIVWRTEMWDLIREIMTLPNRYPHEHLYGAHFGPSIETRYPNSHELPILLDAAQPGQLLFLAPDVPIIEVQDAVKARDDVAIQYQGRLNLGPIDPGTRVEISVKTRIFPGRQIHVLLNDTYRLRLTRPDRIKPAETRTYFLAFDPRYLRSGENTFTFTVSPMVGILERMSIASQENFVAIEPPGFTLRLARDEVGGLAPRGHDPEAPLK